MFISGTSSISSYKQMLPLNSYVVGSLSTSATTVTTTPTILGVFATNLGQPNITVIPVGNINIHYDVEKASGGQHYYTYAEIYKRTSGGTETLLTTSDVSTQNSTNDVLNIDVTALLSTNTLLDLTDIIVIKIYAVMLTSSASISLRIDNGTNARIELPYASGTIFDIYTTGGTLNSGILSFKRNDNQSYTVNLTPIINNLWTAGTGSGSVVLSGSNSVASGILSVAEGSGNTASGNYSHAEGYLTTASGEFSHAEGNSTTASNLQSHAEGLSTRAAGYASHAEGYATNAAGDAAHAEGWVTYASHWSHSEGRSTTAYDNSHAEGFGTVSNGQGAHAEGISNLAQGSATHVEGYLSTAFGIASHVEGYYNTSLYLYGDYSSVGGQRNLASGNTAFIHSSGSTVIGDYSSILGGKGHRINANVTGSTILGGSFITGTTSDTVYGVNFNASGNIISGGTNLSTIISTSLNGYVTTGGTQTLINKTLTSPTINGGNLSEINNFSLTQSGGFPFYIVEIGNVDFTASRNLQFDMKDGTRNIVLNGNLSLAANFTTAGSFATTLTTTNTTNVTLPTGGTLSTIAGTETLTNKRVTPRVGSTTSSATPTINTDNVDYYELTAQAVNITSFTTNLSGTPTNGQKLWIAITGTAARTIAWGASFESSTITLPVTTVTTARLDVGFIWNSATSKWRCIGTC
jgi:hypothetical protein